MTFVPVLLHGLVLPGQSPAWFSGLVTREDWWLDYFSDKTALDDREEGPVAVKFLDQHQLDLSMFYDSSVCFQQQRLTVKLEFPDTYGLLTLNQGVVTFRSVSFP